MRKRFALPFALGVLATASAAIGQGAQPPAVAPNLVFDVASVRPAAPIDRQAMLATLRSGRRPESMHIEGARATFTYMSLKELIAYAYKVRTYQIDGPDWMVTDRFDIAAKLPEGATRDDVPAMLQALLIERFHLASHLETKEHPVLGLMAAKSGAKLVAAPAPPPIDESAPLRPGETKVDSSDGPIYLLRNANGSTTYNMGTRGTFNLLIDGETGTMHLTASGMTLKGFAGILTSLGNGGRQVVDMTGIAGNYELAVDFSLSDLVANLRDQGIEIPTRPGEASLTPSDPTGNTTVSEALGRVGLKLEKSKAMIEQRIVDHVEKAATEN